MKIKTQEEQDKENAAFRRRFELVQIAGQVASGLIHFYPPMTFENGQPYDKQEPGAVAQLSPAQITEIGLASYEIAAATLQAIEIGENAQAEAPQESIL